MHTQIPADAADASRRLDRFLEELNSDMIHRDAALGQQFFPEVRSLPD